MLSRSRGGLAVRGGLAAVLALAALVGIDLRGTSIDSAQIAPQKAATATPVPGTTPKQRKGPFAVILVIDAARADEIDFTKMPNLTRLAAAGTVYSNAWVGQLPSITESSHATIGTGVLPKRHLILGDTWRVPGTSQMAPNLLDGNLTKTGYIGKLIQQSGAPSLAGMVHQHYPGSLVAALSAHKIYAADAMGAGRADFVGFGSKDSVGHFVPEGIPGHVPAPVLLSSPQLQLPTYPRAAGLEDNWTTTLGLKFLFKYHPRLMMVNFPEVDTTGHLAGTDATIMQPLYMAMDREIGRLVAAYGRAGMLSQTYWIITSDHGMIPAAHLIQHSTLVDAVKAAGGDPLYIGHGDLSEIWLKNLDAVPRVAAALARANIPNVAAVFERNTQGRYTMVSPITRLAARTVEAAYLDLLNTLNQGESPDIVLLYDENTITMTPSFQQVGRKGDHGGATWGSQHIPLIVSGPGIRQAYNSQYPARLVDIAPTVETLLGIRPAHQDGVPLADAMLKAPAWATAAQVKRAPRMIADVRALQNEAALRPNL